MFEDSRREIRGYQEEALREFLVMVAPPSERPYGEYARTVRENGARALAGQRKAVERAGDDSYGPLHMDISAIAGLLVESAQRNAREILGIPNLDSRIKQEVFNIRNDRNDIDSHLGVKTELLSLGASYVMAEHLMRFLLMLSQYKPAGVPEDDVTDYCDRWFATVRSFIAGLETVLLDYEHGKESERRVEELLERVLSREGEERDNEYNDVCLELSGKLTRADKYGHERSGKELKEASRTLRLFDLKAAEAGIAKACKTVRFAAVLGEKPWFIADDYASRAATLLRLSRRDGLETREKVWLAGVYKCGLLPTHTAEEGDRLLREVESGLESNEQIEQYKTEDGHTFYRVVSDEFIAFRASISSRRH